MDMEISLRKEQVGALPGAGTVLCGSTEVRTCLQVLLGHPTVPASCCIDANGKPSTSTIRCKHYLSGLFRPVLPCHHLSVDHDSP